MVDRQCEGGQVSGESGDEREGQAESFVGSGDDGGHDGHDEGECGYDGAAKFDNGMD